MTKYKDIILLENLTDKIGRIYDKTEVNNQLVGKTFLGELWSGINTKIELENVTHIVDNITLKGKNLVGDLFFMRGPLSPLAEDLYSRGLLQTSIRSTGLVTTTNRIYRLEVTAIDLIRRDS